MLAVVAGLLGTGLAFAGLVPARVQGTFGRGRHVGPRLLLAYIAVGST
ncbi:hypothetical protein [Streptomyces sp. JHA26]|nr:hypothetical protein [Streptomyces sp. JHA26]